MRVDRSRPTVSNRYWALVSWLSPLTRRCARDGGAALSRPGPMARSAVCTPGGPIGRWRVRISFWLEGRSAPTLGTDQASVVACDAGGCDESLGEPDPSGVSAAVEPAAAAVVRGPRDLGRRTGHRSVSRVGDTDRCAAEVLRLGPARASTAGVAAGAVRRVGVRASSLALDRCRTQASRRVPGDAARGGVLSAGADRDPVCRACGEGATAASGWPVVGGDWRAAR